MLFSLLMLRADISMMMPSLCRESMLLHYYAILLILILLRCGAARAQCARYADAIIIIDKMAAPKPDFSISSSSDYSSPLLILRSVMALIDTR